jgi:hypothetical protein
VLKYAPVLGIGSSDDNPYHRRRRRKKRLRNMGLILLFWLIGAVIIATVLYSVNDPSPGRKRPIELPGQELYTPNKK